MGGFDPRLAAAFQAGCRHFLDGERPFSRIDLVRLGLSDDEQHAFIGGYQITRMVAREIDSDPHLREERAKLLALLHARVCRMRL